MSRVRQRPVKVDLHLEKIKRFRGQRAEGRDRKVRLTSGLRPPTSGRYGLDAAGCFTRPEWVAFHLPARLRTRAGIAVAQTAVGTWVFGYAVRCQKKCQEQACRALGSQFTSRSGALSGGVLAIVHWLRERRKTVPGAAGVVARGARIEN